MTKFRKPAKAEKPVESLSDEKVREIISDAQDSNFDTENIWNVLEPAKSTETYKRMSVNLTKEEYVLLNAASKIDRRPMQHFIRAAVTKEAKRILKKNT